ncbi:hypothetical protein [Spiroplasma taiwanense]|uniref:hypothetical protein n=1 Tax=Spiroplasma taiwanense TaxID=2145 RepID=UPI00035A2FE9|nr:hypothetical protein [Spiroplasma taiwanense]
MDLYSEIYIKRKNEKVLFKNLLHDIYEKFKKDYSRNIFDEDIKLFSKKLFENNLINILGLTTTAKQKINFNEFKKELFIDYPINYQIMDEVSKSSTIDVINTVLLSHKIMLAGDYKQLTLIYELNRKKY